MRKAAAAALTVLALGLAGCADTPAEPVPIPTVTVTAEPVIHEVTPQSCLDAIDQLADVVALMGQIQDLVPKSLDAAVRSDVAALETFTSQVHALNDRVGDAAPSVGIVVNDCRNSR